MTKLAALLLASLVAATSASVPARAQFPERTVKIVVPFPAGGTIDQAARALGQRLHEKWNTAVVVENRPGAGNTVGAAAVAQAAPDGHTLLFANTSVSVNPSLFKTLPYDTLRDLAPVVYLTPSPNVLLVQKTLGVGSLKELIALAKSRTDKPLSFGSVGRGSAHHLCGELVKSEAGINLLHVPYRGVAPALLAVNRGEVDLYCSDLTGTLTLLQGDKMVPLGITSPKRAAILQQIPTLAEAGLPNYSATGFLGIMTTGGTPPDVIRRLNAAINEVIREPEFVKQFAALGHEMTGGTIEAFAKFLREDIERYKRLTQAAGIAPE